MEASWYVGGSVMTRSSSASALPDNRYDHYSWHHDGVERHHDVFRYDNPEYQEAMSPAMRMSRHTSDSFCAAPQPAFYVLKEEGRSRSVPAHGHGPNSRSLRRVDDERILATVHRHTTPSMAQAPTEVSLASDSTEHELRLRASKMIDDDEAAAMVLSHFRHYRRRTRNSSAERILKSLICPKSPAAEFDLDDEALENIFHAANEIFFNGHLRERVSWRWSDQFSLTRHTKIIGTTALREAEKGGYETLIVLSQHYLKDRRFNRRLLISTFLHELIHSYLFVRCGVKAKECGGHTAGFRRIATLIDDWAGPGILFLSNMEADLHNFATVADEYEYNVYENWDLRLPGDFSGSQQATYNTCIWPTTLRYTGPEELIRDTGSVQAF